MKSIKSIPLLQESEGDNLPDEKTPIYDTFIVQHKSNFFPSVSADFSTQGETKIQPLNSLKYCPYCNMPSIQSNFYFNLLYQAAKTTNHSFSQNYFENLGPIGSGSFGSVIRVSHHVQDVKLQEYAIKRIAVGDSKPWLMQALQEVTILQKLKHPNIIQYHHCWLEDISTAVNLIDPIPHLHILLDYAKGGSLLNLRYSKLGRQLAEHEFCNLLLQACRGLEHLHQLDFISRDVKLSNFLITGACADADAPEYVHTVFGQDETLMTQGERLNYLTRRKQFATDLKLRNQSRQLYYIRRCGVDNLTVLLTDFGQMGNGVSAGTEILTAPEVFAKGKHCKQSDIFSLGLSFMVLLNKVEIQEIENVMLYQSSLKQQFIDEHALNPQITELLLQMTANDHHTRPTIRQLITRLEIFMSNFEDENQLSPSTFLAKRDEDESDKEPQVFRKELSYVPQQTSQKTIANQELNIVHNQQHNLIYFIIVLVLLLCILHRLQKIQKIFQ